MDSKRAIEEAFTEMAPRYEQVVDSELRLIWGWSYREFVDQLIKRTRIDDDDLVLDIATGTGVIPLQLSSIRSNGNRYIGLDITPAMLQHAQRKVQSSAYQQNVRLTCASAMDIPFRSDTFHQITCGLATHHMDTPRLIAEMNRVLRPGGRITIADVGASPAWKWPLVRFIIRVLAFLYFLPAEGRARAWAEARAVSNMLTPAEWEAALARAGFTGIIVSKLESRNFWAPAPIALNAQKCSGE